MTILWKTKNVSEELINQVATELNVLPSMAKLLSTLDITNFNDAQKFLKPDLSQVCDPFLLKDIELTIERIKQAIDNKERILIYGDYDADGVTTVNVFKRAFNQLGVEVDVFCPNRFVEGYGLNYEKMKEVGSEYDLIISGDTGIRAFKAADYITNHTDCDLIVTDHHEPLVVEENISDPNTEKAEAEGAKNIVHNGEKMYIPNCIAVVDQHRVDDVYPNKSLAGVGVAFKVMHAVFSSVNANLLPLFELLDFVAVGSIADLAPQMNKFDGEWNFENRLFCKYGISLMNERPKPWVKALALTTGIKKTTSSDSDFYKQSKENILASLPEDTTKEQTHEVLSKLKFDIYKKYVYSSPFFAEGEKITSTHIGFKIGPNLNAPGRLFSPVPALELLFEEDEEKAIIKALDLAKVNSHRQEQTKSYVDIIKELEEGDSSLSDYGIVTNSDAYHPGIAGLVAGKIQQHFYRPTISLCPTEVDGVTVLKGSARSIDDVHILHCLDYVNEKIGGFIYGGHPQAAGMTVPVDKFEAFRDSFREACMRYDDEAFVPKVYYDLEVHLSELNFKLIDTVELFEPFGEGMFKSDTKSPLFFSQKVRIDSFKMQKNDKGANFKVSQGNHTISCVTFNKGKEFEEIYFDELDNKGVAYVDILFSPSVNEWMGNKSVQIQVSHMRPHS